MNANQQTFHNQTFALLDQTVDVMNDLYKMIFIKQANQLNTVLPKLFEKIADYSELLFTPNYTDVNGVIHKLVHDIDESDFDVKASGQVEIIGWLYQYYNDEPKALSFKKTKYNESDIPAVTQLFTPDWIVKYLVENSLGRFWIDKLKANGDTRSEKEIANSFNWQYYMPAAKQIDSVQIKLAEEDTDKATINIEDIKLIDPAMGSGHILVYAYDVFAQIYESLGYSTRDAAHSIIKNNVFGLDIDTRAFQLSYFALMMKLRHDDRRAFSRNIQPNVFDVPESSSIDVASLTMLIDVVNVTNKDQLRNDLNVLVEAFKYGNEYGSLIHFDKPINWTALALLTDHALLAGQSSFETIDLPIYQTKLAKLIEVGQVLSQKYDIGVMNPPYMGGGKMDTVLSKYVKQEFPNSKSDLFGVFIERLGMLTRTNGYCALITQHSWMFLSSFEQLRTIMTKYALINLAHLGTRAFEEIGGEVVQTVAFVTRKSPLNAYIGTYERLVDFDSQQKKKDAYIDAVNNPEVDYIYRTNQSNFESIPGSPIAYWASADTFELINETKKFGDAFNTRAGMITGDNSKFIRLWHEVSHDKTGFNYTSRQAAEMSGYKWFPYSKGGDFRRWFGNNEYVVNWENDGKYMRNFKDSTGKIPAHAFNLDYIFHPQITWSSLSSKTFSARLAPNGFLFDASGSFGVVPEVERSFQLGFLNSVVAEYYLGLINPTLNFQKGNIASLPIKSNDIRVEPIVETQISLSKADWDSFETSWDFATHPLIQHIDEHNRKTPP